MPTTRFRPVPALPVLLAALAAGASAADWVGWYDPIRPGAGWTLRNAADPADAFTVSVFALAEHEGHPAFRFGTGPDDHTILYREGGTITIYAVVEEGVLRDLDEDVVLGEVVDGAVFSPCFEGDCTGSLIRRWLALDPALRGVYGVSPPLGDMLVIATYDADYPPNVHNFVLESNLPPGAAPPAGAVTGVEWYLRDVGLWAELDVEAATGALGAFYETEQVLPVPDAAPGAPGPALAAPAPNPFNARATIRYRAAAAGPVTLRVLDARGRTVRTLLADAILPPGDHACAWDGADDFGRPLPSGPYLVRLDSDGATCARLVSLVK